ncbi:WxL domain-containing protein [Bacillus thuringiensis]|uniref:WxL domain-containing protein n=1 Tax=Bacillus thuringiensis TaxID=1428 RepID=UPI000CD8C421|nr:WxL domain-containing protein [Bacillus thuringiensis]
MKKTVAFSAVALLTTIILGPPLASADANGGNYNTHGVLEYLPSTDPTNPVDPLDPTNPVTPTDPNLPGGITPDPGDTTGPLSIDFASEFNFGQQKITTVDTIYNAEPQGYKKADGTSTTGPNYVQVTDNRGTLAGWSLEVKQNDDFIAQNATAGTSGATLTGASITLKNLKHVSSSPSNASIVGGDTVLVPGQSSGVILGAKVGEGAGTHLIDFGDDTSKDSSVTLTVPGKTTKLADTYVASLTWSLTDTPAN